MRIRYRMRGTSPRAQDRAGQGPVEELQGVTLLTVEYNIGTFPNVQ